MRNAPEPEGDGDQQMIERALRRCPAEVVVQQRQPQPPQRAQLLLQGGRRAGAHLRTAQQTLPNLAPTRLANSHNMHLLGCRRSAPLVRAAT